MSRFAFLLWLPFAFAAILPADRQPKFINKLPIPSVVDFSSSPSQYQKYHIQMREVNQSLGLWSDESRSVYTTIWGYNGTYPGPTIIVNRNQTVAIYWENDLPDHHLLSDAIDPLADCGPRVFRGNATPFNFSNCSDPEVRTVVHLHGARVEQHSDGYPGAWWDNTGGEVWRGDFFAGDTFVYTNDQEAATLWYHDHAVGVTRLNVYTGLVGFYIIHDENEISLKLPSGEYDIPLVIQDKNFQLQNGQLKYNYTNTTGQPNKPKIILGVNFAFILVNGMAWPYVEVKRTKYRFRILNGCDSRFLNLSLSTDVPAWKIATDQGLLDTPVVLNLKDPQQGIFMGPAERNEIILDFTNLPTGTNVTLQNGGNWADDFQDPISWFADLATAGLIVQFRVVGDPSPIVPLPTKLRPTNFSVPVKGDFSTDYLGVGFIPPYGPLVLGDWIINSSGWFLNQHMWGDLPSEHVGVGNTKDWFICKPNVGGIHPIHIHFLEFEIIQRFAFNANAIEALNISEPTGLLPGDFGPKDIVHVHPGTCVQVRLLFGLVGRYIWHCHILSHEDFDMMRPLIITPNTGDAIALMTQRLADTDGVVVRADDDSLKLEDQVMLNRSNYAQVVDNWDGTGMITELEIIPVTPTGAPQPYPIKFLTAHAVLMALAWGFVLPLGALWNRHVRATYRLVGKSEPSHLPHAGIQMFGLIMILIAFIIAFVKLKSDSNERLVHVHRAIGITVFTLAWFNPFSGILRAICKNNRGSRYFTTKLHTWFIRCAFILAFVQIPIGMYLVDASYDYTILYVVLMAVMLAVVGIAELILSWNEEPKGGTQPAHELKQMNQED